MSTPLRTAEDVRRHIEFKVMAGDLREPIGARMLELLASGNVTDYAALHRAAVFQDPPILVYHTAPLYRRAAILAEGLRVCQPGKGGSWAPNKDICRHLQANQPPGVYVTRQPDDRGMFAHWPSWDVWEIRRGDLPWRHDELNPGCWSLAADVPACQVRLHGTY